MSNVDLWLEATEIFKYVTILGWKVESNMEVDACMEARLHPLPFLINDFADCVASVIARRAELPEPIVQRVRRLECKAFQIRQRLAGVLLDCVQKDSRQAPGRALVRNARVSLEERIRGSKHMVTCVQSRLRCSVCKSSVPCHNARAWLQGECTAPLPAPFAGAVRVSADSVTVGKRPPDPSPLACVASCH